MNFFVQNDLFTFKLKITNKLYISISPEVFLKQFVKLLLDFKENMSWFLLEFDCCVYLLHVVWESDTRPENNIIHPFFHVIISEPECW